METLLNEKANINLREAKGRRAIDLGIFTIIIIISIIYLFKLFKLQMIELLNY